MKTKELFEQEKESYLANLSPLEREIYWLGYEDGLEKKWQQDEF
jgi:hypothetical protein